MSVSAAQSATAYGYGQLQRQVAQRNVAHLEAKAQALEAAATDARRDAEAAERRANQLQVEAGSARTAASNAVQAISSGESAIATGVRISAQTDTILKTLQSDDSKKLYGRNGQSLNSAFKTGSLINFTG